MKKVFFATAALISAAGIASAQLTLPLTENFNTGGPDNSWISYLGAYSTIEPLAPTAPSGDGYVMNVNDGSGHMTIFLADDDGSLSNYSVVAQIYVPVNTTSWSRFGIQVRCQTNDNWNVDGLYFFVDSDGDDYMRISRRDAGVYSEVELLTDTYTRDAWHEFRVDCDGNTITAYFDGAQVYTDSSIGGDFPTGYIGLYNYLSGSIGAGGSPTYVDRVSITEITSDVSDWSMY